MEKPDQPQRQWDEHLAFVPVESVHGHFSTSDREAYQRDSSGVIRRVQPKVRGKQARRAEREARRRARRN